MHSGSTEAIGESKTINRFNDALLGQIVFLHRWALRGAVISGGDGIHMNNSVALHEMPMDILRQEKIGESHDPSHLPAPASAGAGARDP